MRKNADAVSEVISFLLSFMTAFLLLSVSLYAFQQLDRSSKDLTAQAELKDVTNRVALAVQEAFLVAGTRHDSLNATNSTLLRYNRTLSVPLNMEGFLYNVTLDRNFVNATLLKRPMNATTPTFNTAVKLPAVGQPCTVSYAVCVLTGTVNSGSGKIHVSYYYEYDQGVNALTAWSNITVE